MNNRAHAQELYNKGVTAANDKASPNNITHAYQSFVSACYADPSFGEAWYAVGNANSDLEKIHAAIACYRMALECKMAPADRAKALCNIGWRLHCLGENEEAFGFSEEAVKLDPNLSLGWINLSLIYQSRNNVDKAIECNYKAFALEPQNPTIEMALAFALLFGRKFQEGFKHFEARFPYRLTQFLHYPYPKWLGEKNKTVFLVADQGLGDTLSFARFVEVACERAQYVHAAVQPELMRLFQHSFMHIKNLNLIPLPAHFPQADAWTTFVSLPFALGLSDAEIRNTKHISLPTYSLPKSWKVEGRKLHIGVAWRGSPLNDIDKHRNIPVTQFFDLYRVPGVQLYGLQVGEFAKELHDAAGGAVIRDLSGYVRDVVDTLTLLKDLDMVITAESALGHIASLAGIECIIPYSYCGKDYRIGLDGTDIIWSPKHRAILQGKEQRWQPVFSRIEGILQEKIACLNESPARSVA